MDFLSSETWAHDLWVKIYKGIWTDNRETANKVSPQLRKKIDHCALNVVQRWIISLALFCPVDIF